MKGSEAVNKYDEMRQRQQEEFNKLPIKFAYGNDQFKKMMQEFGLKENQTDKLYSLSSAGGYYLKTDAPKIKAWQKEMCIRDRCLSLQFWCISKNTKRQTIRCRRRGRKLKPNCYDSYRP